MARLRVAFHLMRVVLGIIALQGLATAAEAKIKFGSEEQVRKIEDISLPGPKGEKLFLGYKISHHFFLAPHMYTDDGYVLGIVGAHDSYYPLTDDRIEELQKRGYLRKPLPPYEIDPVDKLYGYLLWIMLALLGMWAWVSSWWKARKQARAAASGTIEPAMFEGAPSPNAFRGRTEGSALDDLSAFRPGEDRPVEIGVSNWKLLALLAMSVVFCAGGIAMAFDEEPGNSKYDPAFLQFIGGMVALLGIAGAFYSVYMLIFWRGPVMTLSADGFQDHRILNGPIPWTSIAEVRTRTISWSKMLELHLHREAATSLPFKRKRNGRTLMISPVGLATNVTGLAAMFEQRLAAAPPLQGSAVPASATAVTAQAVDDAQSGMELMYVILDEAAFPTNGQLSAAISSRLREAAKGIESGGFDANASTDDRAKAWVNEIDGRFCAIMFVDAPNPLSDDESFIRTAYWLDDAAISRISNRKAHVIVSVARKPDDMEGTLGLLSRLTAAIIETTEPHAIAVIGNSADALWPAPLFLREVDAAGSSLPIGVLVSIKQGVDNDYVGAENKPTLWGMTHGLEAMGRKEIETRGFSATSLYMAQFLVTLAHLQVVEKQVYRDGETITLEGSPEQYPLRETLSSLVPGKEVLSVDLSRFKPVT